MYFYHMGNHKGLSAQESASAEALSKNGADFSPSNFAPGRPPSPPYSDSGLFLRDGLAAHSQRSVHAAPSGCDGSVSGSGRYAPPGLARPHRLHSSGG